jgi:hypothetical protein
LDEVFIRAGGLLRYLWRAIDQDAVVLDILVPSRRDADDVWSSIGKADVGTTALKTHIDQPGVGNDRCSASSHASKPSAFSRRMRSLMDTAMHGVSG